MSGSDASQQVALEIRRYLEQQHLRPGDRIGTEHVLAEEFGVSRPTLREALRLLASSHLIRVGRGRSGGIFVANTPNEGMSRNVSESIAMMLATESVSMEQLLEARIFLEVPLAGLAAQHAGDDTVAALEGVLEDQRGHAPGTDPFNAADAAFHRILAQAAGNDLLLAFTGWTLEVLQPQLVDVISAAVQGSDICCQHGAILDAVRAHDAAAAERAMRLHLEHLLGVLRDR
jgi:GntR family transcriptional regulator, transcriptional repressor for pyruvate dehydrogenase complex